jgi:hypothetical protein
MYIALFFVMLVLLCFFFLWLNNKKLLKKEQEKSKDLLEENFCLKKEEQSSIKIINDLLSFNEELVLMIEVAEERTDLLKERSLCIGQFLTRKIIQSKKEIHGIKEELRSTRMNQTVGGY